MSVPVKYGMPLSDREVQVLALAGEGLSDPQIADRLGVAEVTVQTHFRRIGIKLGCVDRAGQVGAGYRTGVLAVRIPPPKPQLAPSDDGGVVVQVPVGLYRALVSVTAGVASGKPPAVLREPAVRALHMARAHVRDPRDTAGSVA